MRKMSLNKSFENCPVIDLAGWRYFVHPLCDGCIPIDADLLDEAAFRMVDHMQPHIEDIEKVVCIESMGIPIGTMVASMLNLPLVIVRKRDYSACELNQLEVQQDKEYEFNPLFINSIYSGDKVFLVDDVIASGNTINQVAGGIQQLGAEIIGIGAVAELGAGKTEEFSTRFGCEVFTLINVEFEGKKLVVQ